MGEQKRVVVTGMGAIAPVGNTVEECWANIIAGRSGLGPITRFDPSGLETRIAGEVKGFNPEDYIPRQGSAAHGPLYPVCRRHGEPGHPERQLHGDAR